MRKRLKNKKAKQHFRDNYPRHCWCGQEMVLKEKLTVINECLGIIHLYFPYAKCPIHDDFKMNSIGWDKLDELKRKRLRKLLLEKFNPDNTDYYPLGTMTNLSGLSMRKIKEEQKMTSPDFYVLKHKGVWKVLKESAERYIRTKGLFGGNGRIKLVDYKTEADNWIKRVLLHENYDIDVEFYDGTCRRTNVLEYLKALDEREPIRRATLQVENFMNPCQVDAWGVYYKYGEYDYEDVNFNNSTLYMGELIPRFEGGRERDEDTYRGQRYIFE